MPTRGRSDLATSSLDCWRNQTLPSNLIVLDDQDAPSFPDGIEGPSILYQRLPERLMIGNKRNIACGLSTFEYIALWDSDDWYAPGSRSLNRVHSG